MRIPRVRGLTCWLWLLLAVAFPGWKMGRRRHDLGTAWDRARYRRSALRRRGRAMGGGSQAGGIPAAALAVGADRPQAASGGGRAQMRIRKRSSTLRTKPNAKRKTLSRAW